MVYRSCVGWLMNCPMFYDHIRQPRQIDIKPQTANSDVHYNDVIMSAMTSKFTSPTIDYSTAQSGIGQRKHQSSTGLSAGNSEVTGEFPAQEASN